MKTSSRLELKLETMSVRQTTSVSNGGNTISYKNDSEGRRAFVYNELGQLVGEFDSGGAIVSSFHYASQNHSPDLMLKGSVKYYLVKDHLGSVSLVVNSDDLNSELDAYFAKLAKDVGEKSKVTCEL